MYFKNFPEIYYLAKIGDNETLQILRDITLNVRPLKDVVENVYLYDTYDIVDGDTAEVISEKLYGTPLYHWILMLVNEKYDYINDWPMDDNRLSDYVTKKYGVGMEHQTHLLFGRKHFTNENGYVCDENTPNKTTVTNYDYEFAENEKKRRIKIVNKTHIGTFAKDLEQAFVDYVKQ